MTNRLEDNDWALPYTGWRLAGTAITVVATVSFLFLVWA